jgi:hypothetical protein
MISSIVILDIKTNNLKAVTDNRNQIDRSIDTAVDDGITRLAELDGNNNITINKDAAVNSFFLSLYSSFGVLSDKPSQEKLNLYIPVITVTMEDGYYVFYSDKFKGADGNTYVTKRWSERFPYCYEDNDFIYGFTLGDVVTLYDKNGILTANAGQTVYILDYHDLQVKDEYSVFRAVRPDSILLDNEKFELTRKGAIIDCIENSMAYYTSRHNRIAEQYGITYNFSLPVISRNEWAPYLDDISMFIVFQGYPYGNEEGETYNRFTSAGAKVTKNRTFFIEQKGWYLIYHRDTCPELLKNSIILIDEPYYSVEACAAKGAYACPVCSQTGVFAPCYTP